MKGLLSDDVKGDIRLGKIMVCYESEVPVGVEGFEFLKIGLLMVRCVTHCVSGTKLSL